MREGYEGVIVEEGDQVLACVATRTWKGGCERLEQDGRDNKLRLRTYQGYLSGRLVRGILLAKGRVGVRGCCGGVGARREGLGG